MITSASDFIGEYNIPNRSDPQTAELINGFIDKYEPQLLTELLGADLYTLLKEGLLEDPVLDKWTALSDKVKVSIICYVYYYYRIDNVTSFSGTGEIASVNENSKIVSGDAKMVARWNEMVDNNCLVVDFVRENPTDYPYTSSSDNLPPFVWMLPFNTHRKRNEVFSYRNRFDI